MKLAVSNIAWTAQDDASIAPMLQAAGADAIEVAPGRLVDDFIASPPATRQAIATEWAAQDLPIVSMQALLFGRPELSLFDDASRTVFLTYFRHVFAFARDIGAGPLVFGSPGNRRKGDLTPDAARDAALPVLRALGEMAGEAGVTLCLEPNAPAYGCDFMTTLDETAAVVRAVGHPAVGLIVDTGNMALVGDGPDRIAALAGLVRHVHLSRPNLVPLHQGDDQPGHVLTALREAGYDGIATVEMRATDTGPSAVARAVELARQWMGPA